MLEIACFVDIGVRPKNDDRAAINKKLVAEGSFSETTENSCMVVVCDGVGGEAFGNEAAEITADIFSGLSGKKLTIDDIKENIKIANEAVVSAQKKKAKHSKMSTTIAGLHIYEKDFIAFNVGDSRVYRYREPYIMQLSTDHSLCQEQINMGFKPRPEHEDVITRYIGGDRAKPDIVDGKSRVHDNDIYVLCSDGVCGSLEAGDFEKILSQEIGLEEKCKTLVNLALEKGSQDNLSIIIVRRF